jgi:ApaG protein
MYQTVTQGVKVCVNPEYLSSDSEPEKNHYLWAYTIEITNLTPSLVQLMTRRWTIIDGHGRREEIAGDGVVGKQPLIEPGAIFSYTSGCPLTTDSGFMQGHYMMQAPGGEQFTVDIPLFSLDIPDSSRTVN